MVHFRGHETCDYINNSLNELQKYHTCTNSWGHQEVRNHAIISANKVSTLLTLTLTLTAESKKLFEVKRVRIRLQL